MWRREQEFLCGAIVTVPRVEGCCGPRPVGSSCGTPTVSALNVPTNFAERFLREMDGRFHHDPPDRWKDKG